MKQLKLLDGRLKLRHLVLVQALEEHGSLVAAAAAMHVTQPVATRSLHDLEQILGVRLFERGPRGVTPTSFGLAFIEHARAVLAQVRLAGRHLDELADGTRGTVVVGSHLAGTSYLLPMAIRELKRQRPDVTVVVRESTPDQLRTELATGTLDLIVGRLARPQDEQTELEPLYGGLVYLIAGRQHPFAGRTGLTLADLAEIPWILPTAETDLRNELDRFFAREGQPIPRNLVETTSYLTIRQLLITTETVAVVPSGIVHADAALVALDLRVDVDPSPIGLVTARGRALSPATRALVAALRLSAAGDPTASRDA